MPKMKEVRKRKMLATDHRALVLEAVATCPRPATLEQITKDVTDEEFTPKKVAAMVWQLRKEGLLSRKDDNKEHFITEFGLVYLSMGRFDRALPVAHERPGARKPRNKS